MAKINQLTAKAAFGISILFGLSAGAAMADTLTTTSVSMPNGSTTVNINYSGHSIDGGGSAINTGTIGLQTAQGALNTYCVDLFDYIYTGNNSYTFNNNALAAGQSYADGSSHSTWTTSQVSLITALLENGSLQQQTTVNTAALQIAIWDVEYDNAASNGTYNLSNHDGFYFTSTGASGSSSAISLAQTYLNDVTGGTWVADASHTVQYLTANPSGTQNLIYLATTPTTPVATPEPSTVAVFGLGLIGLWAARRRKMI
jgi:PEP-CTERM motif